jgi:hypothetical protein
MEISAAVSRPPPPGTKPRSVQTRRGANFTAFTPTAGARLSGTPANHATLRLSLFPAF